jgi:DNA-binding NarL/FixJ family response regulator
VVEGSGVAAKVLERVVLTALTVPLEVQVFSAPQRAPADLTAFGLALVDIDLDDRAAQHLLERLPRHCWRVATTLYDEEERLLPALQAGVHGYLLKQDRYERQVERLQRILRQSPEISPALARSLLEHLRLQRLHRLLQPMVEQTLDGLGKGSSPKEVASRLNVRMEEVDAAVVQVFELMKQHATTASRRLD